MTPADVVTLVYLELLKVVGGAAVVVAALSAFLGKILVDRIARREALQRDAKLAELKAELDRQSTQFKTQLDVAAQRSVFVDKVQFEHEYDIYRKAWEKLFALRLATMNLRPMLDHHDPSETQRDRVRRRMREFKEPFNDFSHTVEMSKPFYPRAVYESLIAVREKCRHEFIDYEHADANTAEYWKEARKSQQEIIELIEASCEAIRQRIAAVRIA